MLFFNLFSKKWVKIFAKCEALVWSRLPTQKTYVSLNYLQKIFKYFLSGLCLAPVFFVAQNAAGKSARTRGHQKLIIEEKQKEIKYNIRYAKIFQSGSLSSEKYFEKHLAKKN